MKFFKLIFQTFQKLPKYHQIKLQIIKEVLDKISKKEKVAKSLKHFKKSPSHKSVTAIKPASLDDKKNLSNYYFSILITFTFFKF